MLFGFWLADHMLDNAVFINNECGANGTHESSSHKFFLPINSVLIDDLFLLVGNEGERQVVFFLKFFVAFATIHTYANYFVAFLSQVGIIIAQVTSLSRATWCIVFRIKIKDDFLPL